ncbi:hypothetical protein CORC01_02148 [Colletotrichum orchidophilum]|uniref:Uncharacterized protein n=1 Tax=Colletotrichum orchidophilum TaxID=1209926 RepID=A0A1G4BME1_9PEZI|nr:uncharacterized protein CORC01_02148 [Colletotrichum orchidophilum]OHF02453.1 hypothetical protein CORC01_02148 [Colletotrichum orchidophilum]
MSVNAAPIWNTSCIMEGRQSSASPGTLSPTPSGSGLSAQRASTQVAWRADLATKIAALRPRRGALDGMETVGERNRRPLRRLESSPRHRSRKPSSGVSGPRPCLAPLQPSALHSLRRMDREPYCATIGEERGEIQMRERQYPRVCPG